jgi:hypothetical protein
MTLDTYSIVELLTNKYEERGVSKGSRGIILDVYNEQAYEVEFFLPDGTTIAWFSVRQDEVREYNETLPDQLS